MASKYTALTFTTMTNYETYYSWSSGVITAVGTVGLLIILQPTSLPLGMPIAGCARTLENLRERPVGP